MKGLRALFVHTGFVKKYGFSFSLHNQGASGNQSTEDLIKQPDFSDKIKQLLGSLQQNQNQNQGGPPPGNLSHQNHTPNLLFLVLTF